MNMFFYMPTPGGRGDELLSAAAPLVSRGSMEVFSDLEGFAGRIRRPKDLGSIALIWNPTREDLREIGFLRNFLAGIRILLVLPDQEKETIMLAHRIFPTYIAYVDDGIAEIVSVLKQLARPGGNGPATRAPCG